MTNASLVISNHPHTVIQQEQKIEVDADYFEYQSNAVYYVGGVKMRDPELEMSGESVRISVRRFHKHAFNRYDHECGKNGQ